MQKYVLGFAFTGMKTQVALIRKLRPLWQYGVLISYTNLTHCQIYRG